MTAEEISKIKINSLRDGRSWVAVVEVQMRNQADIMRIFDDKDIWADAQTEHYDLRQQKRRIQNDMAKFVKVKSGQK